VRSEKELHMDRNMIVRRIAELDHELTSIKSLVAPVQRHSPLLNPLRGITRFLLSYWVFLSFLAAVGTAVYVKYEFDIDYFEQYRDQSTKKILSDFYGALGDRMLARSEWQSAASAYKESLQINPNNEDSTIGLVEAQVFLPYGEEKYATPDIIDVKLRFLQEQLPNNYTISFLQGIRSLQMGESEAARESFEQSIKLNPNFPGGYLVLGYIAQSHFDLKGAADNYAKAVLLDRDNADAYNNLGFMYLLEGRYEQAMANLSISEELSPRMLTAINLGDAFRYIGYNDSATKLHQAAIQDAMRLETNYERYSAGEWTYNFMPLAKDDNETIKRYILAVTREQKLAIAHFALALDFAIGNKQSAADSELSEAERLEGGREYRAFYANKIAFLEGLPEVDDPAKRWLARQRALLSCLRLDRKVASRGSSLAIPCK
jgi:tetratricopeptide (TPR) repeat protein